MSFKIETLINNKYLQGNPTNLCFSQDKRLDEMSLKIISASLFLCLSVPPLSISLWFPCFVDALTIHLSCLLGNLTPYRASKGKTALKG